ncbi:hypothetical protein EWM64_g2473 [Hericium alpestre]|uniref:NmrA-like domain-containing protein n=1 Tax=Hericium alpestre TaxID=135208 RepID=A0A4Z0A3E9_9AGAM|nr:hypothetical protein EWM64_g2473 [Hericium alpestre]
MSSYRNIAVAGPGTLGKTVIQELLNFKAAGQVDTVVVLTRSHNNALDEFAKQGARFAIVDYSIPASLESALSGIDVVISTVVHDIPSLKAQWPLARAAKAVGVKLFVPSEYGHPTNQGFKVGVFGIKTALQEYLKEIGLPFALLWTGFWSETLLGMIKGGSVYVGGDGTTLNSFTAQRDIARFLAYVVVNSPSKDQTLRIESDRKSANEALALYEQKTSLKAPIAFLPLEGLKEAAKDPDDFISHLMLNQAEGKAVVGTVEELDNAKFPGWNPKSVVDVLTSE